MRDVYKNIGEYNPSRKCNALIFFDDMVVDRNKKLNEVVTELYNRGRKYISLVFITQSYFKIPKNVRLNCTHFLLCKFQANNRFSKVHLIIYGIFTLKTLRIFTKNALQNYIIF